MSDVEPENDVWLFEPARDMAVHRADYGRAMGQLSNQLSGVRSLLSRMSPTLPVEADNWSVSHPAVIWSDTLLFDGEPASLANWGETIVDADMEYLFGDADMIENDLLSDELFGEYGQMSALAS